MLVFAYLPVASAAFYEAAPFDCCHVIDGGDAERALRILLIPPADRRSQVLENPDDVEQYSKIFGIVRGGYGNPFGFYGDRPIRDYVGEALAAQLRSLGHTVTVVTPAAPTPGEPALTPKQAGAVADGSTDLVLHGTLTSWEVDVSSMGTRKLHAALDLYAVRPGAGDAVWTGSLAREDHSGGASYFGGEAVDRAKEWHGHAGMKYLNAAIVEMGLIVLVSDLAQPGTPAWSVFGAGQIGGTPTKSAGSKSNQTGCAKDTDCKGDRICEAGVCVSP